MPLIMKPSRFASLLIVLALLLSPAAFAERERYTLDPEHTTVAFLITHVGYADTLGQFLDVEGSFYYDESTGEIDTLEIITSTASLTTHHERRDEHVKGKDFLDVKRYPEMRFVVDGASFTADQGSLEGELSLLGVTRPLTLEVTLNRSAQYPFGHQLQTLGVSARGELDRSDYGMEYGVDNGLVGDRVRLLIEIEANRG